MSGSFKLPDTVTFAGEKMPLDNFDTRESLEREMLISAYRHSSTILIIKRANRYLPVIEKILKKNNIPDDFKYLAAAESEYSNMVSPAGATGFWQIMPETGREEGMEINTVVDERYDVEKSTQFACDYFLSHMKNMETGPWQQLHITAEGQEWMNRLKFSIRITITTFCCLKRLPDIFSELSHINLL